MKFQRFLFFYLIFVSGAMLSVNVLSADKEKYIKPTAEEIKAKLTPLQYEVTQKEGTEPPFQNEYVNNHEDGIYVDRVSGEPLFISLDKYESGTGWPSFTKPISKQSVVEKTDRSLIFKRVEIRSKIADSHLGHMFEDGPAPAGLRYCMNSAAMRFIPVAKMKEEGYEEFLPLFAGKMQSVEIATFAGGCFWCMQKPFDELPGVLSTSAGYTGGSKKEPSYSEVSSGSTGHTESVEIKFDPSKVSYEKLLEVFWKNIDPLDAKGQFCDKGEQYRSEIFYHGKEQKKLAEQSLENIRKKLGKDVATRVSEASVFYPAEAYHQSYYKTNPLRYKYYRWGCGRDKRLEELKKLLGN